MTNITNNTFTGVKWNKKAIKSVQTVAEALLNLTKLFNTQGIVIESLLRVDGTNDSSDELLPDNVSDSDDGTEVELPQSEQ